MAARDGLGSPGLVESAPDVRHAVAGLLAPAGPTSLDVRQGILAGPGTPLRVTGNADTAPMSVSVAAGQYVASKAASNGPNLGSNDATTKVSLSPAPAADSRYDLVWIMQRDSTALVSPDGSNGAAFGVTEGAAAASPTKPYASVPVGALVLAEVLVAAGATATNGAGVTITNMPKLTVARGGILPVATQAERDALTPYEGMVIARLDTGNLERYQGGAWGASSDVTALTGAWQDYTPSLSGVSLGNGTLFARYKLIGKTCQVRFRLSVGSTTTFTAGATPLFGLPVQMAAGYGVGDPIGPGYLLDASVGSGSRTAATALFGSSSSALAFLIADRLTQATVTDTVPWTWAAGDLITFAATYEAA